MRKTARELQILNTIRRSGRVSRYSIAKTVHLSKGTVGEVTDSLLHKGFIREIGLGESSGGRKPVLLELEPGAAYVVGVDFEATSIMAVVLDFSGNLIASAKGKIETDDDKLTIVRKIIETIHQVIDKSGVSTGKMLGIGLGVPGLIDSRKGISISYYSIPGWRDVHIGDLVRLEFGLPTYIDKNIRTMALAEKWFGQARGVDNMVCLGVRSGIGLGIIVDGRLFRGVSESAGEIGHITVDRTGPKCMCGNRGCLQALASGQAIVARMRKRMKNGGTLDVDKGLISPLSPLNKGGRGDWEKITPQVVIQAAKSGDSVALEIMKETGDYLGLAVADVINLFNPELIVFAGSLVGAGELILDRIRKTVEERALEVPRRAVRIVLSELGDNIGAIGAGALVMCESEEVWKTRS
jgi:glucokinase-like ROK family protein